MAHIHELIKQVRAANPELGDQLSREVDVLSQRRAFGLNFERHTPEAVGLPGRRARRGDRVWILPPRGDAKAIADKRLWRVEELSEDRTEARLVIETPKIEYCKVPLDDLVVVAEFRDPIYPGLVSTGKVERGGDKPFHSVINAENYHALQALLYTHRGKVDAIYIDPPYNTGARDWKYNNDYVEGDDMYRHSKWLAFMERRLKLAKELLNPDDSVLIVTIDEKEYLRLGLLLEQTFPEARIQMVSAVINPAGSSRPSSFARTDEYIFVVQWGTSRVRPLSLADEWRTNPDDKRTTRMMWSMLKRTGTGKNRADSPNLFYPIFVEVGSGRITGVGESLPLGASRTTIEPPEGAVACFPVNDDGTDGRWQLSQPALRVAESKGYVRVGRPSKLQGYTISYLKAGEQKKVENGTYEISGTRPDGSLISETEHRHIIPGTAWRIPSHDASRNGSNLLRALMPDRKFPFPKSLYAVEDALRFFVADKPDATIIDFFSGSGTTAHAVMRLNKQDGGRRRSISMTNNEVSADEQKKLRAAGLRPGDPEWEQWGICDYITKPRIEAAITGKTPNGDPIKGDYKFTDEFPMADGFDENVEFFTLTYESPMRVQSHRDFGRIAPLLWLRAGSRGRRIEAMPDGWDVADAYGVIDDIDKSDAFVEAMVANPDARIAFIVTDEDRFFEAIAHALPEEVEAVRLYDSYLRNFEIDAMRGAR
ncbi:site-specific DNA-methyltransferase [Microbacterium bovistercoris]|uniref:Site-specific DNA-methyltransferase n=1 Tax=Microbacterium bovistercoris TaxID=2293570 RepID=A0A371NYI3_9MICO|nr:DNA methyltransferase [Microbacterium bovistercoris]REJ08748.1 site-specific DNA-methyltransferase [Microbacterium bovistercoris]